MMKKHRGDLFVISAPSGAGKTTICWKLLEFLPNARHSVSFTTRKPRNEETNDRDYTFVSEGEFKRMIDSGEFVEWAKVHGNYYGTSRKRLEDMLNNNITVILDIDTQGAQQIRRCYSIGTYVFILPPSMEALKDRLEQRMSNSREEIDMRLKRAVEEIREYKNYDYVIVNDRVDEAVEELKSIVIAESLKTDKIDPGTFKEKFNI